MFLLSKQETDCLFSNSIAPASSSSEHGAPNPGVSSHITVYSRGQVTDDDCLMDHFRPETVRRVQALRYKDVHVVPHRSEPSRPKRLSREGANRIHVTTATPSGTQKKKRNFLEMQSDRKMTSLFTKTWIHVDAEIRPPSLVPHSKTSCIKASLTSPVPPLTDHSKIL